MTMFPDSLKCSTIETSGGQQIKSVVLSKPKALNALDYEMASSLLNALKIWQDDDDVIAIVLSGEGDRAFCAGGDVVSMYRAMNANKNVTPQTVESFFVTEYELDHLIHTYKKPVIVEGKGIVMGGGIGLYSGASHRLVTATTRMAMPEVTIGLYPDVGASYFLPRLKPGVGLFLGLTAANFGANEALDIDMADFLIDQDAFDSIIMALAKLPHIDSVHAHQAVSDVLQEFCIPTSGLSRFKQHESTMQTLANCQSIEECEKVIKAINSDDSWLNKAKKAFEAGSPLSAHLVWEQIQRGTNMSLVDCFKMECIMSCCCAAFGEFEEGVRALLIDKDNQPDWRFKSIAMVNKAVVESFFASPWTQASHPLKHLAQA